MVCVVPFWNHFLCLWAILWFSGCFSESQNCVKCRRVVAWHKLKVYFWERGVRKMLLLLESICLRIQIMIWFFQTVVLVIIRQSMHKTPKQVELSGFPKNLVYSTIQGCVTHNTSHPQTTPEFAFYALWWLEC